MADGGCNNSAENDVVELEAMRKGSFSWHPCQISLCSSGLGLIVEYGDNHLEEVIADKEEVLSRIRVRSTPLQGDDCSSLQQGNRVLATQSSVVKGAFCEARVEKAVRVRHSKRIHCRCSFTIKWLHQPLEQETPTVPASAIMKLSTKSINIHPTISTFFSMLESSNGVDTSLCSKIVDNMNWEMDINVLLEKQIEEISNSTDVSHKKSSKNIVFGLEVDLKGQSQGRTIDATLKEPHVTIPLLNNLKGFAWSDNKQPMDTTVETLPASISSIQEEFTGSRLPLNPLAARAALASLRSTFPQSTELSVKSNVEKGDITSEHFSSITDDLSLKVSATLVDRSQNFKGIVKTLFPTPSAPFSDVSSRAQVKGMEKKNKISEKKKTQPPETRFTRSRIQKNNGMRGSTQKTDTIAAQHCLPDNQKLVASPMDGVNSIYSTENYKGLLGKDEITGKVDSEKVTFAKNAEKHIYPKRTASSAAGEETKKNTVQLKLKHRKGNFSESNELGNASTESKRVKTTPKTADGVSGNSQCTRNKSVSSRKQETRFSPRLRFLPRTRSQTKA